MNVVCFLLAVCAVIFSVDCLFSDIEFLRDFFRERNVVFTINSCWSSEKNKLLLKEMALSHETQLGFYKNSGIEALKKWTNSQYLVLDLRDCLSSTSILKQLNKSNIFVYDLKYLLLVDSSDLAEFSETLERYQLLPNVEMVVAAFEGESVFLQQPYKVGKINELTWENYGNWSSERGLFEYYATVPTPQRRANLKNANLNVVIVLYDNDTWNHLTDYKNPGVDTFTKQDFECMKCVLEFLHVNYSLLGVDSYGYYNATVGRFNGLVYAIQSGAADVSGCSIYFTEDRYAAVDLIKMGNPLAIRFIVKKPSTSYIKNIFWITFTQQLGDPKQRGFSTVIVFGGGSVKIRELNSLPSRHCFPACVNYLLQKVKQNKYSISDVTLIALEAVCQQGTTTEPQSLAGRILALIFFAAFMFIYVSYSANIVVLLQSTTQINNIDELLESRIEAGGHNTAYMQNYFESVKKGPLQKLYHRKIYPDQYFPLNVGMKKLQEGNFAFHVLLQSAYVHILKSFTNHEICGLQELPGYIEENKGYVAVPKHSPYKDIFKVAILKADEYGLQRRTNLRIIMKPTCYSQAASFKSIGIYDCEQVFRLWVALTILSFVLFLVEIFFDKVLMKELDARRKLFKQHKRKF